MKSILQGAGSVYDTTLIIISSMNIDEIVFAV
jgi:hypothetical protein